MAPPAGAWTYLLTKESEDSAGLLAAGPKKFSDKSAARGGMLCWPGHRLTYCHKNLAVLIGIPRTKFWVLLKKARVTYR